MANVYCSNNISFSINQKEKEVLQNAHDIIEDIRYDWFVKDSNAWDNDDYWEIDSTIKMLERLFGVKSKNTN